MCVQDVVQYKCPCLIVSKEFHPCQFLQTKPPTTCFFTSRRLLHLPQKCPACRTKSLADRTTRTTPLVEHIYKPKVEPYQVTAERWKAMKEGVTPEKDRKAKGRSSADAEIECRLTPEKRAALAELRRKAELAVVIPPVGRRRAAEIANSASLHRPNDNVGISGPGSSSLGGVAMQRSGRSGLGSIEMERTGGSGLGGVAMQRTRGLGLGIVMQGTETENDSQ